MSAWAPDFKVSKRTADILHKGKRGTQEKLSRAVIWYITRPNFWGFMFSQIALGKKMLSRTARFYGLVVPFNHFLLLFHMDMNTGYKKAIHSKGAAPWYRASSSSNRNSERLPLAHSDASFALMTQPFVRPSFELTRWTRMSENKSQGKKRLLYSKSNAELCPQVNIFLCKKRPLALVPSALEKSTFPAACKFWEWMMGEEEICVNWQKIWPGKYQRRVWGEETLKYHNGVVSEIFKCPPSLPAMSIHSYCPIVAGTGFGIR